ncbi:MAG: hypothetical protein AAF358_05705 [Pseudomonadota bacterium]
MQIIEESATRLVLEDTHRDKRVALVIASVIAMVVAVYLAIELDFTVASLPFVLGLVALVALWRMDYKATLEFDRSRGKFTHTVTDRGKASESTLELNDIAKAEVSESDPDNSSGDTPSPNYRPDLILADGTRYALRDFHSAGTQSEEVVDRVNRFLESAR